MTTPPPIAPFSYTPLGDAQIRLIHLKPGSGNSPITCTLFHIALSELPDHQAQALSYMWGPAGPQNSIFLNDTTVSIRPNLWSALWHIRQADFLSMSSGDDGEDVGLKGRTIWIDALCINQKDILERNSQVRVMSSIYKDAKEVIVWLGVETEDSQVAMKALEYISSFENDREGAYEKIASVLSKEIGEAIITLLDSDYFHRLWIVQELILATSLIHQSGLLRTSGNTIIEDFYHVAITKDWGTKLVAKLQKTPGWKLMFVRSRPPSQHRQCDPLYLLLDKFLEAKCTDPRDKVYGLLSLANDCRNGELVADYRKTPLEVYEDTVNVIDLSLSPLMKYTKELKERLYRNLCRAE